MQRVPYFCPNLIKFGFSQKIFMEAPSIKSYLNQSSGTSTDTSEWTDGQTDGQIWSGSVYTTT
jgi:hypothetical protein